MNTESAHTPTRIISQGLKNSCYDFRIERNGRGKSAELTYNLNDGNPTRILLRIREEDCLQLFPELQANRDFEQFRKQVRDKRLHGIGNISIAKGLVLDQFESSYKNPDLGIAVHRMGPVPVFLLPSTLTGPLPQIDIYGKQISPIIAVYPKLSGDDGTLIKDDLLRSFNIRLDTMFSKYLEDVAEHFHDIENYLPRTDVCRRAKQAETVLKQSIEQKVQLILKYAHTNIDARLHPLANKVWANYSTAIVTAALARVFALYMINELYRLLGIKDKSPKYEQDWDRFSEVFSSLYPDFGFEDLFHSGSELFLLRETRAHYLAHSNDTDFEALYAQAESRGIQWVQRFVAFTRFVASLRRESPSIGTGRLFLSLQHNVIAAADLYRSVTGYVADKPLINGQPGVQVFAVNDESPGADIERLVKTRIWLSDVLLAVIPTGWEHAANGQDKNLTWIVKEVDYALLLERLLRLFVEEGVQEEQLIDAFGIEIDLIAPTHGRYEHDQRKERRLRQLRNVTGTFVFRADTKLNRDLQAQIDVIVREARERHTRDVIIGFFRQFDDPQMVAKILSLTDFPQTKKWICNHVADARRKALIKQKPPRNMSPEAKSKVRAQIERDVKKYQKWIEKRFDSARIAVANRGLTIDSHDWHLLEESGDRTKRTFRSNLRSILACLMPEATPEQVGAMHKRVFSLVMETGPMRLAA